MHAAQRPVTVLTSGTGSDHVLLRGDVRIRDRSGTGAGTGSGTGRYSTPPRRSKLTDAATPFFRNRRLTFCFPFKETTHKNRFLPLVQSPVIGTHASFMP